MIYYVEIDVFMLLIIALLLQDLVFYFIVTKERGPNLGGTGRRSGSSRQPLSELY